MPPPGNDTLAENVRRQATVRGKPPDNSLPRVMQRLRELPGLAAMVGMSSIDLENYDFLGPTRS